MKNAQAYIITVRYACTVIKRRRSNGTVFSAQQRHLSYIEKFLFILLFLFSFYSTENFIKYVKYSIPLQKWI